MFFKTRFKALPVTVDDERELVKKRLVEKGPDAFYPQQPVPRIVSILDIQKPYFFQTFAAQKAKIDGAALIAKRMIRAYIRSGFLSADVLLARLER